MSGDDALKGFVADSQPSAALAPGNAQLHEGSSPLGESSIRCFVYFLVHQIARPTSGWSFERDAVLQANL
ncbi:hypothetical protein JFV28_28185 [Pseudomonas sp. TH05]|uniref:hypothetical protein n=1 Tax=unclassified Pseudomonas TaxID=196821 RepID=UPI0019135CD2|nr:MULTISPECIES: hypothetical protein [unclassified Pseudomonas]MBK5542125.1 hypothetical protein [Pseudomonas sp. TH07]MBK5559701.1 hypothetical protein [Pseudomonas sp. TH05]